MNKLDHVVARYPGIYECMCMRMHCACIHLYILHIANAYELVPASAGKFFLQTFRALIEKEFQNETCQGCSS